MKFEYSFRTMTAATAFHLSRRLSVAPMMDWTDRDCRFLLRLLSRHTLLYTEMVTTGALIHGDRARFLAYDQREHPVALQLGGSDPDELSLCAKMGEDAGYDEINLNVGCPSDRVQSGRFGACLMAEPELVAEGVAAMRAAVRIPVTVKTRLGIDEYDSYEFLTGFIDKVSAAGCEIFILHARNAWLQGLSPKENRHIPPLNYERVYQVKKDYPHLHIDINGGIQTLEEVRQHLDHVDGVMMGRAIYHNPYLLAEADRVVFGKEQQVVSRHEVVEAMLPYIEQRMKEGRPLKSMTRHLLGLFQGQPGGRRWRRHLSENAHLPGAGIHTLREALSLVA
ncbi:MAG: tRNA dihydrouridine(20/20a) synthase DusA [Methylophaga sp.]|jgi:tRNA-dihydrouridine synthase A